MGTVHVRRVDDQVIQRLKRRAAANKRSLESQVRSILEQATEDGMAEKIRAFRDMSRRLRQETGVVPQTPSHVLIREDRDGGHGDA